MSRNTAEGPEDSAPPLATSEGARRRGAPGPRPGQRMKALSDEEMQVVLQHPAQVETYRHVAELLDDLRKSSSPLDFLHLQEKLFEAAFAVDRRRAECARVRKRVERGKGPPDTGVTCPSDQDPLDLATWQLEEFVHERLLRQFRSVGDSIAWALFGHDRRIIASLASNASPGPLVKRDDGRDAIGRVAELAALRKAVADGDFAILHDLTNCLRIGDISRLDSEGAQIGEIKNNPRNVRSSQLRRMEAAIGAIERQRPLPGSRMTVVDLDTQYRSGTVAIGELFEKSRASGVSGAVLRRGQTVLVADFRSLNARFGKEIDRGVDEVERKRGSLWRRARLDDPTAHRLHGRSVDEAARMPLLPPYGIYPASVDVCAALICDYAVFETHLSVEALAESCASHGLQLTMLRPEQTEEIPTNAPVFRLRRASKELTVFPNSLAPLLLELVDLDCWSEAMAELLDRPVPITRPWARLKGDSAHWIP